MAEIILMKTLKLLLAWVCYLSSGIASLEYLFGLDLINKADLPPAAVAILVWMVIVLWCLKIVWYIVDKVMDVKERMQRMEIEKGDRSPSSMPYIPKIVKKSKK